MDSVKLYFVYVRMFFRSRGEYKVSFIMGMFANFYCYLITYVTFWILINRFSSIGGWNFPEISILYGLNLLTYAISGTLFWKTLFHLEQLITTAGLDRFLLRPVGIISQLVCQGFQYTFIGQIVVTVIFLVSGIGRTMPEWNLINILYLLLAVLGGILLHSGAMVMIGSMSFWVLRSTNLGNTVYYDLREFIHYPLTVYPKFVKIILTYVFPWAFINYYPSLVLLNKYQSSSDYILGLVAPCVGLLVFSLSLVVFKMGLKRYTSAGN